MHNVYFVCVACFLISAPLPHAPRANDSQFWMLLAAFVPFSLLLTNSQAGRPPAGNRPQAAIVEAAQPHSSTAA